MIRNKGDIMPNMYNVCIWMNMIFRLNDYYTYFLNGVEIYYACAMKPHTKTMMLDHEKDICHFIIEAACGPQNVTFSNNNMTSRTEWIAMQPPDVLFEGIANWVNDAEDQQLYNVSNKDYEINQILNTGTTKNTGWSDRQGNRNI